MGINKGHLGHLGQMPLGQKSALHLDLSILKIEDNKWPLYLAMSSYYGDKELFIIALLSRIKVFTVLSGSF